MNDLVMIIVARASLRAPVLPLKSAFPIFGEELNLVFFG
jgi:hypothetical protein